MIATLNGICSYRNETVDLNEATLEEYVSTESMLPNRGGVGVASSLPGTGKVKFFKAGDTLISNIRPYFKKIWRSDRNGYCSNDVLVFKADSCLPDFLYWTLSSDDFFAHMTKTSKGTKMPRGDKNAIMQYEINLPSLSAQEAVCSILNPLQKKMVSNAMLNDYLRELIKVLFAHWFKDFAPFQSEDTYVTEIGDIPTSVKLVPLAELTKVITKGTTPTTLGFEYKKSGINFIKGESIGDDHSFDYGKFAHIDEGANAALKRSVIEDRDLLFTIAGTLGRFAMAEKEMIPANTNQAVGIIRADERLLTPEVLLSYFIGGWQEDYYARRVQQAVQANLSLTTLKSLPVPILEGNRRSEYEEQIVPIIHAIEANNTENRRLSELRDILLPKLMSGEIDVSKIDLTQLNNHLAVY